MRLLVYCLAISIALTPAIAVQVGIVQPKASMLAPSQGERDLDLKIAELGRAFDGDIGIAVQDIEAGHIAAFDGETYFPQQSVSKFWVALTALNAADRGTMSLSQPATLQRSDLTLFHQPIASQISKTGSYRTTIGELLERALQQSDNTCNDFVLHSVGGPEAVRAFFHRKGIEGIRFGPGEKLMQSRLAGLTWRSEYSIGNAFYVARSKVSSAKRRAAFDDYVADPVDGAMPISVVRTLARLRKGELLSPASTTRLLEIMSHTRTGPQRLKGGLAPGWTVAHKTGTGQQIGAIQTGYNDIGIITSPEGRPYAVAVMIRRTAAPIPARMAVMQHVVRAVIDYDQAKAVAPRPTALYGIARER